MTIVGRNQLSWEKNKLLLKGEETGFSVIVSEGLLIPDWPHTMYKVKWPDGILSKDHYGLTRAKDHAVKEFLKSINNPPEDFELEAQETVCGGP